VQKLELLQLYAEGFSNAGRVLTNERRRRGRATSALHLTYRTAIATLKLNPINFWKSYRGCEGACKSPSGWRQPRREGRGASRDRETVQLPCPLSCPRL